ncbi:hypothetical protein TRSC58_07100 [Trypanosoma rangeli SC58]|uniref:PDEase domain-containing protein n=1 Tax=Trypanosoma rangeli SC58 TaxID=429131 RepID=A0A061ITV7_TRYRA|nr:hypothetical protein TRSC58_07100 [Trypanosoma rangeli SC58]
MQPRPHRRTFVRPPVLDGAFTPAKEFNAILRIQKIRQTLCGVVASRNASSERGATPREEMPYDVQGPGLEGAVAPPPRPQGSAAGRFLLSSQRRVEELTQENHRLELLCITQEETMKQLREALASGGGVQAEGAVSASVRRERSERRSTPSLSRRSQATRPVTECGDTADAAGASQVLPVPSKLMEAVQNVVGTARWVFPRRFLDAGASGNDTGNGLETACAVLDFVAGHLAEWDRLASESAQALESNALFSQTLVDLEGKSETWRATILALVKKLQATQAEQRHFVQEKDSRIAALTASLDVLAADAASAVEERDRFMHRCEDLERSLCLRAEDQLIESQELERLRRDCELLRGELDSARTLLSNDVVAASGDGAVDADERRMCPQEDVASFHATIACLTSERDALQNSLDALTHTLAAANERVLSLEEEKKESAERLRALQDDSEKKMQEIEHLKRLAAASASHPGTSGTTAETSEGAARDHQPLESHRRWFLQPVEYCRFDEMGLPAPVVDFASVLGALDADHPAWADGIECARPPGLFFHIGCAIAEKFEFFGNFPSIALDAWKRFLLQLQTGFRDTLFYTADHAAACAQFFYALLVHSGMVPYMSRAELLAAVTAALCMDYGHPGVSGCLLAAAQDPAAAGIHGCILLERRHLQDLGDILAHEPFNFLDDSAATHSLLDDVSALLLPDELHGHCNGLMRACLGLLSEGPLQIESRFVRCRLVQLLLRLSQYAFCMRAFGVNERCAERWFGMIQRQAKVATDLGIYGFEVPHSTPTVAEAQLQLIELTVLPLCRIAVEAFPSLHACEKALRANHATWTSRAAQHPTGIVAAEAFNPLLHSGVIPSHVEGAAGENAAAAITGTCALDEAHVSAPRHVDSGSLLVNTSCFLASQKEMFAAYEESTTLRHLLEALLAPIEALPAPQDVAT